MPLYEEAHTNHEKHLCSMVVWGAALGNYKELVKNPKSICMKCGRLAAKEDNLCKPWRSRSKAKQDARSSFLFSLRAMGSIVALNSGNTYPTCPYVLSLEACRLNLPLMRRTVYFEKAGPSNTDSVLEAVKGRVQDGDIKAVVVPVTTGKTAALFSSALGEPSPVVAVSEDDAASVSRHVTDQMAAAGVFDKLVERHVRSVLFRSYQEKALDASITRRDVFDITLLPLSGKNWSVVRDILYAFGHGMKVAIEVSIVAVELSRVAPYTRIIAVGGTHQGADTAIVVRASPQREAFGRNHEKRLSVNEVLAMPVEKSFGDSAK